MKFLGYSSKISINDLRQPNPELIADCLHWLILRYDPTLTLERDLSSEALRATFIGSATEILASKANIQLNPQKLYNGDHQSVKEILRLISLVQLANSQNANIEKDVEELPTKSFDMKLARPIINDISNSGAYLYEILCIEQKLQEERCRVAGMSTDINEIERNIKDAIEMIKKSINSIEEDQVRVEREEKELRATYEKRKAELERTEKCLATFRSVRPAYMDEYEMLQKDLQDLFSVYLEKIRNLQWLETQLEGFEKGEQRKHAEVERKIRHLQRQLHGEELHFLQVDFDNQSIDSVCESEGEFVGAITIDKENTCLLGQSFRGDQGYKKPSTPQKEIETLMPSKDFLNINNMSTPSGSQDLNIDDNDSNF